VVSARDSYRLGNGGTSPIASRTDDRSAAYYQRKIAEGNSKRKEALRALKRRISDAVWRQLQVDLGRR
jgi:hypothetical protein